VIVEVALAVWYFPQFNRQADNIALNDSIVVITGKDYVRLPDGTRVTLNKGSVLTYNPTAFGDTTREVTLKGEGYFDVGFDTKRPFKVWTGKIVTKVLGTAFHISVKRKDKVSERVTVTVSRGRVSVGDEQNVYDVLTPNQQIAVNTASKKFVKSVINADTVSRWKNDFFILDQATMAEAAKLIGKRFKVNVTVVNKSLQRCVISAWFMNNESLDQVMKAVCIGRQATYKINNGNVTIKDGRGCD
jgi:transmembrane sensor